MLALTLVTRPSLYRPPSATISQTGTCHSRSNRPNGGLSINPNAPRTHHVALSGKPLKQPRALQEAITTTGGSGVLHARSR